MQVTHAAETLADMAIFDGTIPLDSSYYNAMNQSKRLFLLLLVLLLPVALFAESHPDFTGKWKLNVQKSDTGTSGVTELVVDVDHKDPVFNYTVKGMAGGQQFVQSESFTTDGKPSHDSHGLTVTASWDGPALVAVGTAGDGSMVNLARLALSEDGKTITREITQRDDPQKHHEIYEKQ